MATARLAQSSLRMVSWLRAGTVRGKAGHDLVLAEEHSGASAHEAHLELDQVAADRVAERILRCITVNVDITCEDRPAG